MGPPAIISIIGAVLSVRLHCGHGSVLEKRVGKNFFVADDGGPWRIAAQTCEIVFARLRVKLRSANLRLLAAELGLFANTARAAAVLGGLLGRCRGSIRLRPGGLGSSFTLAFGSRGFARCSGLLGLVFGFLLAFGGVGTLCRRMRGSAQAGCTEGEPPWVGEQLQVEASERLGKMAESVLPVGFSSEAVTFSDSLSTGLSAVEVFSGCSVASVGAFTGVSSAMMARSSVYLRRIQEINRGWLVVRDWGRW